MVGGTQRKRFIREQETADHADASKDKRNAIAASATEHSGGSQNRQSRKILMPNAETQRTESQKRRKDNEIRENMRSDIEHAAVTTDPYTYQHTDEEADDPKHVGRTVAADEAPAVIAAAVNHAAAIAT